MREKARKNAAQAPAAQAMISSVCVRSPFVAWAMRTKRTVTRNVSHTAMAEGSTDRKLSWALTLPKGSMAKRRPMSTYRGVPGGCGMPSRFEVAMNSPESQNGMERFMVRKYTTSVDTKTNAAVMR